MHEPAGLPERPDDPDGSEWTARPGAAKRLAAPGESMPDR